MDNPALVIEAPILDDESINKVYEFLQNLTFAFDAHYYYQLRRYSRAKESPDCPDYLLSLQDDQRSFEYFFSDEIPF